MGGGERLCEGGGGVGEWVESRTGRRGERLCEGGGGVGEWVESKLTRVVDEVGSHGWQETGASQQVSEGGATPRLLPLTTPLKHGEVLTENCETQAHVSLLRLLLGPHCPHVPRRESGPSSKPGTLGPVEAMP